MSTEALSASAVAERLVKLRDSRSFRTSASNAAFSIVEYIAQPAAMLLAAPFLVHRLGLPQYGIWMLVSAILGSVGILSTGFGDATVKYVSTYRGQHNHAGVERTIRATLTINTALGTLFGTLVWAMAPFAVHHVFKIEPQLHAASIQAIRISAVILVLRSMESAFVGTLRAFERYGPPVGLNVFLRAIVVISAVILVALGRGVVAIMGATLFWSALVLVFQAVAARGVVGPFNALPTLQREALREVFRFGCFSWLQALAGVVFSYIDRFLVAALLGTAPVAIYVLCVQATQPIHGVIAAGFNFLFPHLSSRYEAGEVHGPRRVFRLALGMNLALAAVFCLPFVIFEKRLLTLWMGTEFALQAFGVLAILAVSSALLAMNVVAHYGLLALGRVKLISALNVTSGVVLIGAMGLLIPVFHLPGAALGRVLYAGLLAVPYLVASYGAFRCAPAAAVMESLKA